MSDLPILFSAPMVKALLTGRKTQTRRLCAWANNPNSPQLAHIVACDEPGWFGDEEGEVQFNAGFAPGDRLWVREAWRTSKVADELKPSQLVGGGYTPVWYEADRDNCDQHGRYRHARFMPRWASRLTLLITDVCVQRLQDISEADAEAEGCVWDSADGHDIWYVPGARLLKSAATASECYSILWDSINGLGSWQSNPWVIAITFDVLPGNINGLAQ